MTATTLATTEMQTIPGWRLAVAAVAAAIFTLVSSEMLPIGILQPVAGGLGVSDGVAGLMVTAPGVVAALSALGVTLAAGRLDRRLLACGLMALLTLANLACALAPNFAVMLAARLVVGLTIGGFWAIAGGLALRLAPPRAVAGATAVVFGGIGAASVLGVPLGTTIGDAFGWRAAFGAAAAVSLGVLALLATLLPKLPSEDPVRAECLPRLLGERAPRAVLLATFFIVIGHFAGYTYVRPLLAENGGVDGRMIGALLLVYGVAGVIGNFVAGAAAARDVRRTLYAIVASLGGVMLAAPFVIGGPVSATMLLVLWGLALGGVSVSLQIWMRAAAPDAMEAANALWASVFNASIALGAFLGGLAVDAFGPSTVMWLGGAAVLIAAAAIRAGRA